MPEPDRNRRPGSLDRVRGLRDEPDGRPSPRIRGAAARLATRHLRWSDGSEGEALRWYGADEILICEGDLIGKTREQLRSLHFHQDRDWLQS